MIKLYEGERHAKSEDEALTWASNYTGFNKADFKCEVIIPAKKIGLFKKEDGLYNCWYEYEGMDAHKELKIVDAYLYVDTIQKNISFTRWL